MNMSGSAREISSSLHSTFRAKNHKNVKDWILKDDSFSQKKSPRLVAQIKGRRTNHDTRRMTNYSNIMNSHEDDQVRIYSPQGNSQIRQSMTSSLSSFTIKENKSAYAKIQSFRHWEMGRNQEMLSKGRQAPSKDLDKSWSFGQTFQHERHYITTQNYPEDLQINDDKYCDSPDKISSGVKNNESHVRVSSSFPKKLDVLEDTPLYCKIHWHDSPAPAKVCIDYYSKGDLDVFGSLSIRRPSSDNNHFTFKKPNRFTVRAEEKTYKFRNNFIYLW